MIYTYGTEKELNRAKALGIKPRGELILDEVRRVVFNPCDNVAWAVSGFAGSLLGFSVIISAIIHG